jgi:hypothetical protein
MPRQRYRGESQGPWHAWVKFAQCSAAQSAGGIGCAGSDAMHSLACSNNVIIVPCSHLPLTAKRDSDSGEERQRRLTINAASSLLAWHPRLTQPHSLARATTRKRKPASAVGHQSSWPDAWRTEAGYALPQFSRLRLHLQCARRSGRHYIYSPDVPFVRSFVRLHARTIQSSGSTGRLQVRVHHSMMMMMMMVVIT